MPRNWQPGQELEVAQCQADLVCFGLEHKLIYSSGFIKIHQKSKKLIVPNYFNPLIRKNTAVYFFVDKKKLHNVKIFKGDGDQDRPN